MHLSAGAETQSVRHGKLIAISEASSEDPGCVRSIDSFVVYGCAVLEIRSGRGKVKFMTSWYSCFLVLRLLCEFSPSDGVMA